MISFFVALVLIAWILFAGAATFSACWRRCRAAISTGAVTGVVLAVRNQARLAAVA